MDGEAGSKFNQWVRRAILKDESRNRRVGKLKDTGARQDKGAPGPLFVLGVERFTEGLQGQGRQKHLCLQLGSRNSCECHGIICQAPNLKSKTTLAGLEMCQEPGC